MKGFTARTALTVLVFGGLWDHQKIVTLTFLHCLEWALSRLSTTSLNTWSTDKTLAHHNRHFSIKPRNKNKFYHSRNISKNFREILFSSILNIETFNLCLSRCLFWTICIQICLSFFCRLIFSTSTNMWFRSTSHQFHLLHWLKSLSNFIAIDYTMTR